jgi:serine/threonine protein kinase
MVAVKKFRRLQSPMGTLDMGSSTGSVDLEFEREVEFLRKCRHANVLRFFGLGVMDDQPFLVLELANEGALKTYLKRPDAKVNIPLRLRLQLLQDVATGMAYIHTVMQATHRDLKSGNVLIVSGHSARDTAKIADFGTTKLMLLQGNPRHSDGQTPPLLETILGPSAHLSMTSCTGTPMYMAPEVIAGGDYNQKADIFSYAVLVWETITAESPDLLEAHNVRTGGPVMSTLLRLLNEGKRLPMDDRFSPSIQALVAGGWHAEPRERPSFESVLQQLKQLFAIEA